MDRNQPKLEQLQSSRIFRDLDESTWELLRGRMRRVEFTAGEKLCSEGDPSDCMFLIAAGRISVLKRSDAGSPVQITVLEAGEIAGETSLFGSGTRSATLQALTDVTVWVLDSETFQQLLDEQSGLSKALLTSLSRHLRRETSVVAKLLSRDLDRRFKVAVFDSKQYIKDVLLELNHNEFHLDFFTAPLAPETAALAAGYKAVCVFVNDRLDRTVVQELHGLGVEMIALRCAGFNNVDVAACADCGLSVARVPAYSPYAVAEHAVALMLSLNRRIHRAHARVREGNFSLDGLVGFDMHGKTAGVVGCGKIGECLLRILAGFGCRLLGYDVYPNAALAEGLGVRFVSLNKLFTESDIISLHAPLTPETRYLINEAAIDRMKPGVMLINTSRGALVETRALLAGLKNGHIGAAGLDVYEEEGPYFFEDHSSNIISDDQLARLMTFNNVIITSHQAFLTREALHNIAQITLDNLREFTAGKRQNQLTHAVTPASV